MPRATLQDETEKRDLTSLPDAFVELRKLSYGEVLRRRDLGMKLRPGKGRDAQMDVSLDSVKSAVYDFSHAIVNHNLEDEGGTKLDLKDEKIILTLDPNVAQEIEGFIAEMNGLSEEDTFQ